MPLPNNKQQLADWILRRLGAPVININVADIQLEDCIDEAVQFYQEYHFDGAQRSYRTIKITNEIMNGNKRVNRQLSAPMYDIDYIDSYRVGDRVTTYDTNEQPTEIWIKFDSEGKDTYFTYVEDTNGIYFQFDGATPDLYVRLDSDSDSGYILYDSDQHNRFVYSRFVEAQDEFYEKNRYNLINNSFLLDGLTASDISVDLYVKTGPDSYRVVDYTLDSENGYDSDFYFRAPYLDIDGVITAYDSDTHVIYQYDVDAAGGFVDSASLLTYRSDSDVDKVAYDSDTHVTITYVVDVLGDYVSINSSYVLYDSELSGHRGLTRYRKVSVQPIRYTRQYKKPVEQFVKARYDSDSDRIQFVSYGGTEVTFGKTGFRWFRNTIIIGDVHSTDSERAIYFYRDSDNEYYKYGDVPLNAFDSDVFYFRRLPSLFLDSDGTIVNYDSEKHVINQYNVLSYDSDPTTLGIILYVDSESLEVYRSDSDVDKVVYDSDKHTIVNYEEVTSLTWFDSDVLNKVYWVDSDGEKVVYDSDRHVSFIYDSDENGNYIYSLTAGVGGGQGFLLYDSDDDSDGLYTWNNIYRFSRRTQRPTMYKKVSTYPILYYRHKKIPIDTLIKRNKVILGTRYSRSTSSVVIEKTFAEMWKKEAAVLTEPQLKLDYSKEGQIGIPVPDNVIAVTKVFRIGQQSSVDMYNYEYQMFLNNFDFFYGNAGGGLSNYYTLKMNLEHIDFMLNTQPAIRFNKFKDRLYIDMDWGRTKVGDWLVCEVYEITDPEVWGKMYSDSWLKRYATALVKMQWGSNVRKYQNVELPGGIVLNGQELYDEGKEEAQALEETLKDHWGEMDSILIG